VRLLNTRRLQELQLTYAKPTRSLGSRALQQRAPRQGRTLFVRTGRSRSPVRTQAGPKEPGRLQGQCRLILLPSRFFMRASERRVERMRTQKRYNGQLVP
jgi:hypothetical protein